MAVVQTTDITGKPRKLGSHVDIGAYENDDLIFRDHFY
jgi:hypothetical protein